MKRLRYRIGRPMPPHAKADELQQAGLRELRRYILQELKDGGNCDDRVFLLLNAALALLDRELGDSE